MGRAAAEPQRTFGAFVRSVPRMDCSTPSSVAPAGTFGKLRRFNWLIVLCQAIAAPSKHEPRPLLPKVMSGIEITEECRGLIATEFPFEQIVRGLLNGN